MEIEKEGEMLSIFVMTKKKICPKTAGGCRILKNTKENESSFAIKVNMKETFTFSIFGQSKSWKNSVVVAIPTKKEKFSQCKALLFIIIITNEKRTVCVLIESRGKSDDFKDEEGLLYATRYLIEVKQQRSEFSFAFLHDFQNCTSNDVDDAFTSSVPKKTFRSLEALKELHSVLSSLF